MINSDDKEIKPNKKDYNETTAIDLEKITDYVPEKDISEHDAQRVSSN